MPTKAFNRTDMVFIWSQHVLTTPEQPRKYLDPANEMDLCLHLTVN